MFKPLPNWLTIKESPISGLGLFAIQPIKEGTYIGVVLVAHNGAENNYLRTPLGGFGNHSEDPNCFKLLMEDGSWWIGAERDIKVGEELTWTYTLYSV